MDAVERRAARNAGWMIAGRLARIPVQLLVGVLTARYLGPAHYGLISYAGAYTGFFAAVCGLGLEYVLVRELLDRPGDEGEILGTALVLRLAASALSAVAIVGICLAVDAGQWQTVWVVALCCLGMMAKGTEVLRYWFQSRLRSRVSAVAALAAYAVSAGYKVWLLASGKPVAWFALTALVEHLCCGLILYGAYRRSRGRALRFSRAQGRRLLGKSRHYIAPGLMVAVFAQTDKLMLRHWLGDAETGLYAIAVTVCGLWCFVLSAIIDSAGPGILSERDSEAFDRRNRRLYAVVFYLSALVSVGYTVLAEPLITALYGQAYAGAAGPVAILTWYTGFSYLGVARNHWLVRRGCQRYLTGIYGVCAAANVALNALLIPRMGTSGAALASLITQTMTVVAVPWLVPALRENARLMRDAIFLRGLR